SGLWDINILDGKIDAITESQGTASDSNVLDVEGSLVLPPFIEPHIHLDTTLTVGEPAWNQSGTLFEGIQRWSERKQTITHEDVKKSCKKSINMAGSAGHSAR